MSREKQIGRFVDKDGEPTEVATEPEYGLVHVRSIGDALFRIEDIDRVIELLQKAKGDRNESTE